jgi:glycosyltransferase involved in cell wall biosynthesis
MSAIPNGPAMSSTKSSTTQISSQATNVQVSIIVPVHNGGTAFQQCLISLANHAHAAAEIIVVVDGGTDTSEQIAHEFGAKVVTFSRSGGPARARNAGAKIAQGDILFFVDADVTIAPDTIEQIQTIFGQQPDLGALIGSYDDAPGASNFLSQYKNLFHHYTHQTASEEASTFWGACGAVRREVFWSVGGFDETYRYPSVEDIELGYRLKQRGYRIQLCRTVQVKHLKRWEVVSLLRAEILYRALPWTVLLWRDRQFNNDLNLKQSSRASLILTYVLFFALIFSCWQITALVLVTGVSFLLFLLNLPVYQFFYAKRGMWFTLRVIPWHWLYFLYGGLGFAIGTFQYHMSQRHTTARTSLPQI